MDSRNDSPERRPVVQQPTYQLLGSGSRPEYIYRDMNATQHYGPTHGYLDTHSQHLGHEGSALAATSYPAYHAPMMTAVQGSYAPTGPSTGYYAYASTPTSMSSHATYGHHSLPSIPSLAGMSTHQSSASDANEK